MSDSERTGATTAADGGRSCGGCKNCILADYGNSNYSTEGSTFLCGKALHPSDRFDWWWGTDKRVEFAQQCPGFEAGEPIAIDADRYSVAYLSPEDRAMWDAVKDNFEP